MDKHISNFVIDFINSQKGNQGGNIIDKWNSPVTQKKLCKIIKNEIGKKDENKPKRGKTSYILYCDDTRKELQEAYPSLSNKEITIKLALGWADLKKNNSTKFEEYEARSLLERNKYKEDMKLYNKNAKEELKSRSVKGKEKEKDVRFKKYFDVKFKKIRKLQPELTDIEIEEKIKAKWKKLSNEDKNKYF